MELVLVAVAPDAGFELYELLQRQFTGRDWEAFVLPVSEVGQAPLPPVAMAVAHASDWPAAQMHGWLSQLRAAIGPRRRLLALLPQPPDTYPPETQVLWNRALGYGTRISEAVGQVEAALAGRW